MKHLKSSFQLETTRVFAVIVFTAIYAVGVVWFIESSVVPLYTGGVLGISQLIRDTLFVFFGQVTGAAFLATLNLIMNIPILIIGWFGVSHRFTLYSLISVLLQTVLLTAIPQIDFGLNMLEHVFASASLGGLLIGIGAGGALRYGASTGGLDIVAQFVSSKSGKSVGFISLIINLTVATLGALIVGGEVAPSGEIVLGGVILSYTIVRIIASTIGLDLIHTSYQHINVNIISEKADEITSSILKDIFRGATIVDVKGAYSGNVKQMIYVVISRYEFATLMRIIKQADPGAFIVSTPVRGVYGNFLRKTIT
ncbi:MAG: YitT family protein [Acholeplasmataceae bacterium]